MPVICPHFPNAPEPQVLRIDGDPHTCTRRLLTIHAHPDDETTKGGGSVARYTAAGVGTVLVCCTGGEAGTVLNPALKRLPDSQHWFGLPPDIPRTTYPYDDYILAQSTVQTTLPEDDLFAGVVGDDIRGIPNV